MRNAQNPPSDLTLLGYISLIRERITERVPGIMNPSGPGPIMRPLEAALVAYVLMTADNGWIYPQRARLYLTADEIRSFLGDLGIKFQRQNRYLPPNGQPLPR